MKCSVIFIAVILFFVSGCSTGRYVFSSNPDGASIYFRDPQTNKKFLLGSSPLEYSKSSLDSKKAFLVVFEKQGYLPTSVPIAPTDEILTTVNVNMEVNPNGLSDASSTINGLVGQLFRTQKLIYQKQYKTAILELDRILEEKPWVTQAHIMKGTSYYLMNEMQSAIESWKKALTLDPKNHELTKFLADKNINLE